MWSWLFQNFSSLFLKESVVLAEMTDSGKLFQLQLKFEKNLLLHSWANSIELLLPPKYLTLSAAVRRSV